MKDGESGFSSVRGWLVVAAKWGLGLALLAALVYWLRFSPQSVETVPLQSGTVVAEVMGTGTLEARVSATISPKISGRIARVLVDQGDEVEQGALLVQLDDEELRQQVAIADANLAAARAAVDRLTADKERAAAVFDQAERHHKRMQTLSESNAAAVEELERASESLAIASSDIARAEAAITEGQRGVVAAEKNLEYHRARLQDTRIEAPFAGMIVLRHREVGDVAVPGSAILVLVATDVLWISAWVDESGMGQLAEGQSARVVFRSEPDEQFSGKVIRLGKQADRETRELIVDVQVHELPGNWAIGQRAEVYIEVARKEDVLLLPPRFLVRSDEGQGVFVHQQGKARWRAVQLGLRGREGIEVVEGLDGSEVLVRAKEGDRPLSEGRKVRLP